MKSINKFCSISNYLLNVSRRSIKFNYIEVIFSPLVFVSAIEMRTKK